MEFGQDLLQVIQDMVLRPDLSSAITIFLLSVVNEFISIFPYVIVIGGQLFFVHEPLSYGLFAKLLVYVSIPVGLGATIGTMPAYIVGYFGGKPAINKFGRYVRLSWSKIERFESKFTGSWYDEILFLVFRIIPLPAVPISALVGVLRMSPLTFTLLTLLGFVIRMMVLFAFAGFGVIALVE